MRIIRTIRYFARAFREGPVWQDRLARRAWIASQICVWGGVGMSCADGCFEDGSTPERVVYMLFGSGILLCGAYMLHIINVLVRSRMHARHEAETSDWEHHTTEDEDA